MNCPEPGCTGEIDDDGYCTVTGMKVSTLISARRRRPAPVPAASRRRRRRLGDHRRDAARPARRAPPARAASTLQSRLGAGLVDDPARRAPETPPLRCSTIPSCPRTSAFCAVVRRARRALAATAAPAAPRASARSAATRSRSRRSSRRATSSAASTRSSAASRTAASAGSTSPGTATSTDAGRAQGPAQHRRRRRARGRDRRAAVPRRGRAPDIVKIFNFVEPRRRRLHRDGVRRRHEPARAPRGAARGRTTARRCPPSQAIAYIARDPARVRLPARARAAVLRLQARQRHPDRGRGSSSSTSAACTASTTTTSPIYGTRGYQAPEIAETGPDRAVRPLHGRPHARGAVHEVPRLPEHVPVHAPAAATTCRCSRRYDSLYRLLLARHRADPDDRFQSADEMAAQLLGVLREVVVDAKPVRRHPGRARCSRPSSAARLDAPDWRTLPAPARVSRRSRRRLPRVGHDDVLRRPGRARRRARAGARVGRSRSSCGARAR